jgi:hypothetical protein
VGCPTFLRRPASFVADVIAVERVRSEFEYAPVPAEDVMPLLNRLRWDD